jgi:hypothetical protein
LQLRTSQQSNKDYHIPGNHCSQFCVNENWNAKKASHASKPQLKSFPCTLYTGIEELFSNSSCVPYNHAFVTQMLPYFRNIFINKNITCTKMDLIKWNNCHMGEEFCSTQKTTTAKFTRKHHKHQ